jgi:type I restriction enzyme, S subunit
VNKVASLPVLLPPMAEQTFIVQEVERRLSVDEEMTMELKANLTRAERLRQSILQRAFSGVLFATSTRSREAQVTMAVV